MTRFLAGRQCVLMYWSLGMMLSKSQTPDQRVRASTDVKLQSSLFSMTAVVPRSAEIKPPLRGVPGPLRLVGTRRSARNPPLSGGFCRRGSRTLLSRLYVVELARAGWRGRLGWRGCVAGPP
ncbi:hypothetical protein F4780DRAFT_29540 [Xylariomycetidae sp. FL0641]|nr:hypothetical protein F4780DRAFT_29540 [Xylariomycetidae sp. FL0641]